MDSATVKPRNVVGRVVLCALAFGSIAGETGCARLKALRKTDWPALGTSQTVARDERTPGRPTVGDLYAKRVRTGDRANASALARLDPARTPGTQEKLEDSRVADEGTARVALQPPQTLATLPEPGELTASIRGETSAGPESNGAQADAITPVELPADATLKAAPTLDSLLAESRRALDGLTTYQVKMNHQERVNGTLNPPDDAVLSIRRAAPKAVRIAWPEGQNKGREVLFVDDPKGGLMHVHMANSLVPLPRITMAPNSPLATRNSRHPITEAGFDTIVQNMEGPLKAQNAGDPSLGRMTYEGLDQPEGLPRPCHKVVRVTPEGETWVVHLDPQNHLPVSVQATELSGELLERYLFLDLKTDIAELAQAEAFDPDARWGPSKGLFSRIARSTEPAVPETP